MKIVPFRRLRWLALGVVVLPPVLWGLVLALIPTDWARSRLTACLSKSVGQPVRLASVRMGVLGGVRLHGLEIGAEAKDGPWLKVADLAIDLNLAQLASGRIEPGDVEANGVALRIHRLPDGRFEFGDLLRASPDPAPTAKAAKPDSGGPASLAFRLRNATVRVLDDPSGTRLEFADVEGQGTWRKTRVDLGELRGMLNGGTFEMAAALERSHDSPAFEAQLRADEVNLGLGMDALGYLMPVLAGKGTQLDGRLDLQIDLQGHGTSSEQLRRSLVGRGMIAVDPIALDGSKLVAELGAVLPLPERERFGSIYSQFAIKDGRVSTRDLTLKVANVPVALAGWTDFQGRLDYRVKAEALAGRLSEEARGVLKDLPIDLDELMDLRLAGTLDHLVLTLDGVPVTGRKGQPGLRREDRERLRESGRRLLDRLLR